MTKFLSFLVSSLLIFLSSFGTISTSFATPNHLDLTAEYAVLMDYETGEVLYEKNAYDKMYPASTTKAWSAYIVLKYASDLDEVITIDSNIANEIRKLPAGGGSSMYLVEGESFTVMELLQALMVRSANDAGVALAIHVSGSMEEFAKLMNEEAKSIGAQNTHFTNSHGLPDDDHYTTAYDMTLMAREAMSNDTFRELVSTVRVSFDATEFSEERHFINGNKFLHSNETINYNGTQIPIKYDVVDGIKTGYTNAAGNCLLSSGVKNDMRFISGVFKSSGSNVYTDSRTLLDYGFDNYYSETLVDNNTYIQEEKISLSNEKVLYFAPEYSYKMVLPNGTDVGNYSVNTVLDDTSLPINTGDKVGILEIYIEDELEHTIDLIAQNDVTSVFAFITENKFIINGIRIILGVLCILTVAIIVLVIRKKIRRSRRYNRSIYSNKSRKKSRKSIYSNKRRFK